jgi:nitrous oxidase accessory protein NosD
MIKTYFNYADGHLVYCLIVLLSIFMFIQMFSISKSSGLAASISPTPRHQDKDGALAAPAAAATTINPACGQVIKGNVKLSSNLICNNDGLIVGNGNTRVDLNGFSIKGPGINSNKVGIMVGAQNNTIIFGNGVISGFQSGIYISGSNNIVAKNINVINNKVAIYITGSKFTNINNNMLNNNTIGIASHSNNKMDLKYNLFNENNLSGITFINTHNSTIEGNNILNTTNGIYLDVQSSFDKVDFNNLFNNVLDINNANNLPLNINNNNYSSNNCITSLPSGLCIGR